VLLPSSVGDIHGTHPATSQPALQVQRPTSNSSCSRPRAEAEAASSASRERTMTTGTGTARMLIVP
jgi:hypothetical protein